MIKLLFLFFIPFHISAATDSSIREELFKTLPKAVSELNKSSSSKEIKTKFAGKIKKSEPQNLFINYFSNQNDLTIGLDSGRFRYAYLKVPESIRNNAKNLFYKVYDQLSKEEKRNLIPKDISHDSGSFLEINLPEEALTLKFKNNQSKDLHSIIFWNLGDKKP